MASISMALTILDQYSKKVYALPNSPASKKQVVPLAGLPGGMYFVIVRGSSEIYVEQLIVVR